MKAASLKEPLEPTCPFKSEYAERTWPETVQRHPHTPSPEANEKSDGTAGWETVSLMVTIVMTLPWFKQSLTPLLSGCSRFQHWSSFFQNLSSWLTIYISSGCPCWLSLIRMVVMVTWTHRMDLNKTNASRKHHCCHTWLYGITVQIFYKLRERSRDGGRCRGQQWVSAGHGPPWDSDDNVTFSWNITASLCRIGCPQMYVFSQWE